MGLYPLRRRLRASIRLHSSRVRWVPSPSSCFLPPFTSFILIVLLVSIGHCRMDFYTLVWATFNCDPVSIIAVIGLPSHSIFSLISISRALVNTTADVRDLSDFGAADSLALLSVLRLGGILVPAFALRTSLRSSLLRCRRLPLPLE